MSFLSTKTLKTFGIRGAVSKKVNNPSSATSKRRNSKDEQGSEPAALLYQNPAGRTQVVKLLYVVQYLEETTQKLRR